MSNLVPSPAPELLRRLESLCHARTLSTLGARLADLARFVERDAASIDKELRPTGETALVMRGADHLLGLGGKRLRPLCVALASRVGRGFDERGLHLAVAVELVHSATLLHDDVVDVGDTRRGAPTARALYGNAVSIFAGDWLLIEALRRVQTAGVPGTLERLLAVIEEMILAESLQLEGRGRLDTSRDAWMRVAEGKTAALFRWAMFAGARAGGLDDAAAATLERYGAHLGVAFQATDDLLDLAGDPRATGKALFTDLREGKMTYPLIVAAERDPSVLALIQRAIAPDLDDETLGSLFREVAAGLERTGALTEARALADSHAERAVACLDALPSSPAIDALVTVAEATVSRRT